MHSASSTCPPSSADLPKSHKPSKIPSAHTSSPHSAEGLLTGTTQWVCFLTWFLDMTWRELLSREKAMSRRMELLSFITVTVSYRTPPSRALSSLICRGIGKWRQTDAKRHVKRASVDDYWTIADTVCPLQLYSLWFYINGKYLFCFYWRSCIVGPFPLRWC